MGIIYLDSKWHRYFLTAFFLVSISNSLLFGNEVANSILYKNCLDDWGSNNAKTGFFSTDGKQYYQFANLGRTIKTDKNKNKRSNLFRYGLYKTDTKELKPKLLLTLNLPKTLAIIPHGDPLEAITAFIFQSRMNNCVLGKARYIGINVKNSKGSRSSKPQTIQGNGTYHFVQTDHYPIVFDIDKKGIIEFDYQSYQSRNTFIRTQINDLPLYVNLQKRRFFAWHFLDEKKQRGLVAYDSGGRVAGRLLVKSGDKIIQQKNYFAIAQFKKNTNSINIIELPRWTGGKSNREFEIFLPKSFNVLKANLKVHFEKKVAVIFGNTESIRKKYQRVIIYDYQKKWQLYNYKSPGNTYVEYMDFSPDGNWIFFEIKNRTTSKSTHLGAFSVTTRKWVDLSLATKIN